MSLNQLILFIYLWSEDIPLELIQRQTSIQDDGTAMDWGNMIREVCSQDLMANFRELCGFDNNGQAQIVKICLAMRT